MAKSSIHHPTTHKVAVGYEDPDKNSSLWGRGWDLEASWKEDDSLVNLTLRGDGGIRNFAIVGMSRDDLAQFCREYLEHNEATK